MAKKSHKFTVLSDKVCQSCKTKRIKQRLIEQKEPRNIQHCYKCYREIRRMEQARQDRKNGVHLVNLAFVI